jgi:hypothetical protein
MTKAKVKTRTKRPKKRARVAMGGSEVTLDHDAVLALPSTPAHQAAEGLGARMGVVDEEGCGLPCPVPRDPAMGDKTPEVMAWYKEYQPEEFMRRYGNRVCPEVDEGVGGGVMENDDEGGPVSDFEDEDDERVMVKPRVIMG